MANPHGVGLTGTGAGGMAPLDPLDPDEVRQIQLLAEAVLQSFTVSPNPVAPNGVPTAHWDVRMPMTVIPGVRVEVHLWDGTHDQEIDAKGSRVMAAPSGDTTYSLYLRTPLASRQLATITLTMDFATCRNIDIGSTFFAMAVKREAEIAIPAAGEVTLRGAGASVDFGVNSFVIDVPVEVSVPNWFNANLDLSIGFSVSVKDGRVRAVHSSTITTVSFGVLSGVLSAGCTPVVAKALEKMSDGFLKGIVGRTIADRIAAVLTASSNEILATINDTTQPPPYRLYDLSLTDVGMTYRYCPVKPAVSSETHPDLGGSSQPVPIPS